MHIVYVRLKTKQKKCLLYRLTLESMYKSGVNSGNKATTADNKELMISTFEILNVLTVNSLVWIFLYVVCFVACHSVICSPI